LGCDGRLQSLGSPAADGLVAGAGAGAGARLFCQCSQRMPVQGLGRCRLPALRVPMRCWNVDVVSSVAADHRQELRGAARRMRGLCSAHQHRHHQASLVRTGPAASAAAQSASSVLVARWSPAPAFLHSVHIRRSSSPVPSVPSVPLRCSRLPPLQPAPAPAPPCSPRQQRARRSAVTTSVRPVTEHLPPARNMPRVPSI
jgi:hypothetical protein